MGFKNRLDNALGAETLRENRRRIWLSVKVNGGGEILYKFRPVSSVYYNCTRLQIPNCKDSFREKKLYSPLILLLALTCLALMALL